MRVTRNYRNGMVNFRKNNNKSEAESLVNTLRLNSAKRRSNTLSSILGSVTKALRQAAGLTQTACLTEIR